MPDTLAPCAIASGARDTLRAGYTVPALLILLFFVVDHLPRFMQGDSISYLMTSLDWIPPDRSWAYGFAVSFLLRTTGSYLTYILLNSALLLAVIMACRVFFGRARAGVLAFTGCAIAIAADPLTAAYARFYLSDFSAMAFFIGLAGALVAFLRSTAHQGALLLALLGLTLGAVFTRLAYAPILLMMLALLLPWSALRGAPATCWRLLALLALPGLAVAALLACNAVLFASQFREPAFTNRLSGTFLMGVFAPALGQKDFAKAGIPLSDAEYQGLRVTDYDHRIVQVWGTKEGIRHLVMDRLGDHEEYSIAVDKVCMAIVVNAFKRKPLAFVRVYLHSVALYFSVAEWRKFFDGESGTTRPLEAGFVKSFNGQAFTKIYPDIVSEPSLTLALYRALLPLYPAFLALCSAAASYLLLSRRSGVAEAVASAAFVACLLAVGLYSNYVIPRYVIACVVLGYVLLGMVAQRALAWRDTRLAASF